MLSIPFKALRIGAETINKEPVKYNKSRISGSKKISYNLHIRGALMPGQRNKFTTTSTTKPKASSSLLNNNVMSSYKRNKINTYNYKIQNSSETVTNYYQEYFGDPVNENLYLYFDRKEKMGLKYFDKDMLKESSKDLSPLSNAILHRTYARINLDTKKWPYEQIINTISELRRFPLLVVLSGTTEKDSLEDLHKTHKLFKNIVDDKDVSVLVRCKNGTTFGKEFNDYIKDNRLNNSLAKSTKIVYITSKKIPKPLLTSEWEPEAVLIGDSTRSYTKVDKYIGTIDLQLQINGQDSYWNQIHVGADTI